MITDTTQVHSAFFALFTPAVILPGGVSVPATYAGPGLENFAETGIERYPMIAIQEYAPEDDKMRWSVSGENEYINFRDEDNDGVDDTADVVGEPSLYQFRYDVSHATKDFMVAQKLLSWFLGNFPRWGTIEINEERYTYTRTTTDIPRSDGVIEHNHEFVLQIWYRGETPRPETLVQTVSVTLGQNTLNAADLAQDERLISGVHVGDAVPTTTPGAGNTLTHDFTNQTEVVLTHNQGRWMDVEVYDLSGDEVEADINQPDLNTVIISFSNPFSGTVVLS